MNVQSQKQSTLRDFQITKELGKGSFSTVYRVRRIADSQEYALKKVKLGSLKQKERENALNEVRLLASINDNYIVAYKEAFLDDDSQCLCIVMELMPGGDVAKRIQNAIRGNGPFTEGEIWRALTHMTRGLKTLHDNKVVHRDLKSANVFLGNDGSFKLGDLNVSKVAKQGLLYTQTGTPYYASPEVWRDEAYDIKSDIWSLGCVIYEMACLKTPFRAQEMEQLYKKVQKGIFEPISPKFSKDLCHIVNLMLQVRAQDRPTCEQILNHPQVARNTVDFMQNDQLEPSQAQLLQTIQLPGNVNQLRGILPKSKYHQEPSNKSAERYNDRSTEKSVSPFRSPQTVSKLYPQSRISQSQVGQRETKPNIMKNNSYADKVQKHQLLVNQPRELSNQPQRELPQRELPQRELPQRELPQRELPQLPSRELASRELASNKQERPSEPSRSPNRYSAQNYNSDRRVSPLIGSRAQKSLSPINRPIIQSANLQSSQLRQQQPIQNQQPNVVAQPNLRYNNPVRPYVHQSLNQQSSIQSERPTYLRPQHPQSAIVRQQYPQPTQQSLVYQNQQQSRIPPQSAIPTQSPKIDLSKYDRGQVFPTQARVVKPKTQPNENNQKKYDLSRPAGKPVRPLSSNLNSDRLRKPDYQAQNNLITNNYNHYYPIDQYQPRQQSNQNLLNYQCRQEIQAASRPLRSAANLHQRRL